MIRLCELYNVEFHWRNEPERNLGFDTVDKGISLSEVRQVMANWYAHVEACYIGTSCFHEEDYADEIEYAASISHLFLAGEFVVRDSRGDVVELIDADVVRASAEIVTADTQWIEHRDPDYERKREEELERSRLRADRYRDMPDVGF